MKYAVVYERTPSGYSAYVPDLPGCVAAGRTRAEVKRLIRDSIRMHLDGLNETGQAIPGPESSVDLVEV